MEINQLIRFFQGRKPVLNIVLDGWGIGSGGEGDAISQAHTPNLDRMKARYAHTELMTHGHYVGLPSPDDIGGSEVGHLTMGAGKIRPQGATLIKNLLDSGAFFKGEALEELIQNSLNHNTPLHLMGLLSDGNIHSHISHFYKLIEHAEERGIERLYLHVLLDGRDVPYQSALDYLDPLEEALEKVNQKHPGWQYKVASGGGREVITMDRDKNWEKVQEGWCVHVTGTGGIKTNSARAVIHSAREETPEIIDQDLPGFVVCKDGQTLGAMEDNHSVIFMNFRSDRAVEFSRAMTETGFSAFEEARDENRPKVMYGGMVVYDEDTDMPKRRLVEIGGVENPFGKRLVEMGLKQFRLTETQKFPHVTFFFNGGYREPLDLDLENYCLIPSDKVNSFAEAPEMQAAAIGQKAATLIRSGEFDYGLINFANADMVGHTGDIHAVIKGVEAVDKALGEIEKALEEKGGTALILADHGNGEEMISSNPKTGKREPNTRHSLNPVPVILVDPLHPENQPYRLRTNISAEGDLIKNKRSPSEKANTLSHVFATNYILLGLVPPDDVDPSLFEI